MYVFIVLIYGVVCGMYSLSAWCLCGTCGAGTCGAGTCGVGVECA